MPDLTPKLQFPDEHWAVFNGHVNDAHKRALNIVRSLFPPEHHDLRELIEHVATGIMGIFNQQPNPVTTRYAFACFIFANGLDKEV